MSHHIMSASCTLVAIAVTHCTLSTTPPWLRCSQSPSTAIASLWVNPCRAEESLSHITSPRATRLPDPSRSHPRFRRHLHGRITFQGCKTNTCSPSNYQKTNPWLPFNTSSTIDCLVVPQ
ncbi:hypothetical protein BKA66DRAFT_271140 [Pyrenochaeta sp. MPI-SDFR-AT-0127]|nr:hypothetical protein BKA66DRAFT_271140 [Pyrenochaeta sp. MPI-SDFR-AT-0127]